MRLSRIHGAMLSMFFVPIVWAAVEAAIGAFIVQFAVKRICHFQPAYRTAYGVALLVSLVRAVYLAVVMGVLDIRGAWGMIQISVVPIFVGVFIAMDIYSRMISHPETGPISKRDAALVGLIQFGILAVVTAPVVALGRLMGH